jgi:hypothetical protein
MTSLCPRCSTPHTGGSPFCPTCGFDFRAQATPPPQPPAQFTPPPPPPPSAPASCPRCHAPLYPGYTQCGNCGFDSAQQQPAWGPPAVPAQPAWGAQPAYQQQPWGAQPVAQPVAQPAGKSSLPIILALGGVLLLVVAGGLFVMMPKNSSNASPSPSAIAVASPTATRTPAATRTVAPTPTVAAPTAVDTLTPAAGTEEPSPAGTWTSFTAPDKKWTVRFPSSATPIKESQPLAMGTTTGTITMYAVQDPSGSAVYAVAYMDVPAGALPGDPNGYLALMDSTVASSMGGTLVSSRDATVGTYAARDLDVVKGSQTYNIRIWFVGNRFYMLMVLAQGGAAVYPQHFMATFVLK